MYSPQPSLIARDDTFFGVCEGLGEDLGLNANYLRLGFAFATFFNPVAAVAAYAGAGLIVLATRWLVPNPRHAGATEAVQVEAEPAQQPQEKATNQDWVALAAAA